MGMARNKFSATISVFLLSCLANFALFHSISKGQCFDRFIEGLPLADHQGYILTAFIAIELYTTIVVYSFTDTIVGKNPTSDDIGTYIKFFLLSIPLTALFHLTWRVSPRYANCLRILCFGALVGQFVVARFLYVFSEHYNTNEWRCYSSDFAQVARCIREQSPNLGYAMSGLFHLFESGYSMSFIVYIPYFSCMMVTAVVAGMYLSLRRL